MVTPEMKLCRVNGIKEDWLHSLFTVGVWIKGLDGILETAGGILFLFVGRATVSNLVLSLTQHELLEDPDDWLANSLRHTFGHMSSGAKLFGSIYLVTHGLVKISLVLGLVREKLWSFPVAIAVLGGFIGYQAYRLTSHYSFGLGFLTALDLVIVALVWREYQSAKLRKKFAKVMINNRN